MPTVRPLPAAGAVLSDTRGDGRALRATWHPEAGIFVLSVWKDNVCTATFRLHPDDVLPLVETLIGGLSERAESGGAASA